MSYDEAKAAWREKWKASLIQKYGSWEAYLEFTRKNGRKGGLTGSNGFLKMTNQERSEAGKKGYKARLDKLKGQIERGEV